MAFTPKPIAELRRYLSEQTGRERKFFSIARDCSVGSCAGYHLGRDQIYGRGGQGDKDYSIQRPRDKRGLSDARSAIDINLGVRRLQALRRYLVAEARAGRARDLVEVIGPGDDGRAYDWRKPNWTAIGPRARGDSHEWHAHLSFHRDSETRAKVPLFHGFFGKPATAPTPAEEPDVNSEAVKQLQTLLNNLGASPPLVVDGIYGPLTDAALKAAAGRAPELETLRAEVSTARRRLRNADADLAKVEERL